MIALIVIVATLTHGEFGKGYCAPHTRSSEAVREFKEHTGYKSRPGYVVDHVVPLCCGGADHYSNMQWQSIAEGKKKDRWELNCWIWDLPAAQRDKLINKY